MAMQTIKNGGFVGAEISKINANFSEIESDYAKKTAIPDVPTKTSQLTNDSGFVTNTTLSGYVQKEAGKGLSTEDFTTALKTKLNGLSAPTKVSFTTNNWTNGTYTAATGGKSPAVVMRKDGSNYGIALVDVKINGSNVVITSDEAFDGHIILV